MLDGLRWKTSDDLEVSPVAGPESGGGLRRISITTIIKLVLFCLKDKSRQKHPGMSENSSKLRVEMVDEIYPHPKRNCAGHVQTAQDERPIRRI